MIKIWVFLLPFFVLSCVSQKYIRQYNLSDDTTMYFFPASTWNGNNLKADIDFNHKNNIEIDTICNISIIQKGRLPNGISSILLYGDTVAHPLDNLRVLSVDSRMNTVRITSALRHEKFLEIMKSNEIYLEIIIDGSKYECFPKKDFVELQREFQSNYFAVENILK